MPVLTTLVGSKVALGVVALVALGGGGLTVAAAATLPELIVTETPAPTEDTTDDGTDEGTDDGSEDVDGVEDGVEDGEEAGGPDATGPAAIGLCNAYQHGGLAPVSTAYLALSTAAGEGGIDVYCGVVVADKKGVTDEESDGTEDATETSVHGKSGEEHGKPATSHKGGNGGGHGHH